MVTCWLDWIVIRCWSIDLTGLNWNFITVQNAEYHIVNLVEWTGIIHYYLLPFFTVQIIEYVVVHWFGFYFYLQSKCRRFCDHYTSIAPEDRLRFLTTLSKQYGVNQEAVVQVARSVVSAQVRNHHGKIGNTAEISAKPTLKLHNW